MCRGCGAIVGAGQTDCAVCGASTTKSNPARPVADRETLRFARAILARPYKFTVILLVANFFIFLLMWQSSGTTSVGLSAFPWTVLVPYGAKVNLLVDTQHQWWRLVAPMFVHVNLLHLLVNMYSLWVVGPYVEKLYGSAKFAVFWVVTGVAGLVASYLTVVGPERQLGSLGRFLLKTSDDPSAGASGALFGLVGVLFVFGIKFRNELPEGFKRAFGTGMLPIIVINLFIGYVGRGVIDNAAHLGGLVAGAALALLVEYRRPGEKTSVAISWQILQVGMLTLVAVSFLKVAQHFRDPLPPALIERLLLIEQVLREQQLREQPSVDSTAPEVNFVIFAKTMNEAQETFNRAVLQGDSSGVDKAIKSLESVPHFDPESAQLTERLRVLLATAKELQSPLTPSPSPPDDAGKPQNNKQALLREFDSWTKDYERWLKTNGKTYSGLTVETAPPTPTPSESTK